METQLNLELSNDYAYSKISSSAMLVDLSLSVWTGRKLDKSVSAEVDVSKNTKGRAGNYHKNLLAGSEKLAEIGKLSVEETSISRNLRQNEDYMGRNWIKR